MVKLCTQQYTGSNYDSYFNTFPYELSDFQKYAIEAIVEKQHILITAHTGSGKTLPAEFAIEHLVKQGKKVIYTSPIKALSNQKFYEFTKKYPNISFGILTGDIKFNPEADVLIMTTEILRNTLLQKMISVSENTNDTIPLQFNMDFESELACVIFDEVHYINDADRGRVWEETIMLLPLHVQMVMLSATIDKPNVFAEWIEKTKEHSKSVYLAPTNHRVVPLKHYFYTTLPQGIIKNIKDKEFLKFINEFLHKPIIVKDKATSFNDDNYNKIKKLTSYTQKNNCFIKASFVLNEITKYLNENDMLPAICFVFSRKQVEKLASTISVSLFDKESKIPSTIHHECEMILRKLPNFSEYLQLPEFTMIVKLLEKGVAIHHSGIMPVFREMIELLFSKGFIKLLFATETFAVGINMPTKTVLFTGFEKFNGSHMRLLFSHEYTQMAGRAGRRGLDTIGHVIHLNNLFQLPSMVDYKQMLNGSPQLLKSKFKLTFNLILNMLNVNKKEDNNITIENSVFDRNNNNMNEMNKQISFASKSMVKNDIDNERNALIEHINNSVDKLQERKDGITYGQIKEKMYLYEKYNQLTKDIQNSSNKKRKNIQREMENIKSSDKHFQKTFEYYISILQEEDNIKKNKEYLMSLEHYFENQTNDIIDYLTFHKYVDTQQNITTRGIISTYIQETHSLALTELLIDTNYFDAFENHDIVAILSCFSGIRVKEDNKILSTSLLTENTLLNNTINKVKEYLDKYFDDEVKFNIYSGENYEINYDLVLPFLKWCESENEIECKQILSQCEQEKEIFIGEFVKALLKVNNIVNELKNIAECVGNVEFLHKLSKIPDMTLKFVATNQSLYI